MGKRSVDRKVDEAGEVQDRDDNADQLYSERDRDVSWLHTVDDGRRSKRRNDHEHADR